MPSLSCVSTKLPEHVEDVVLAQGASGACHAHVHRLVEAALRVDAPYLQDAHVVGLRDVQFLQHLVGKGRVLLHLHAVEVVGQLVFVAQLLQGLPALVLRLFVLGLFGHERLAQRPQQEDADGQRDKPHGEEGEERQTVVARARQGVVDNQVGRGADEGEQSEAAGKRHGHEEAARVGLGFQGEAHDDGQHEGHRARVADEAPDAARDEHDEDEQLQLAASGQGQNLGADHPRQPGLEDAPAHNEQARHHDDHRVGKAGQPFFGGQYAGHHEQYQRAQGHDVGTYLPPHEKGGGQDDNRKDDEDVCIHIRSMLNSQSE